MQPPGGGEPPTEPIWQPSHSPPPRKKGHWLRWTLTGGAFLIGVGVAASWAGNSNKPAGPAQPARTHTAAAAPSTLPSTDTPAPQVTVTRTVKQIVFKVWGSGEPDITYGNESDNRDGGGHLGLLGSGNSLPWSRTLSFNQNALYWFVTAQLNGYGSIKCAVVAKVTDYYSDGTHQSQQQNVATAHASGGYNICQAESS